MKRNIYMSLLTILLLSGPGLFAQNGNFGVGTTVPQTTFHVDGAKDNPTVGTPDSAAQQNDFVITNLGNVGIGTTSPGNKMEIKSDTANTSGLKFTNLTSATPVSSGATLGVDANGNVVTVPGNAFTPASGRTVLGSTVNIAGGTVNYNVLSFTLPTAGTYLITYSVRGETQNSTGYGWLTSFLSTANAAGNIIANTEILIFSSNDASRVVLGGTGTGTLIATVTGPTTYYLGARAVTIPSVIYNNADGRTSVSFVKITP